MPIRRSYMCSDCGHHLEVTLEMHQADDPAPICPNCRDSVPWSMRQDFKPVAIGNSKRAQAEKITENILRNDYHVADMQREHRPEGTPQVRYQAPASDRVTWGAARDALEGAIATGRQSRIRYGSGLDILQQNLKSGAEPDLIELSKKRAMRVW